MSISENEITRLSKLPGFHALGDGIYLKVDDHKPRFVQRIVIAGSQRRVDISLGVLGSKTYEDVLKDAASNKIYAKQGVHPKIARQHIKPEVKNNPSNKQPETAYDFIAKVLGWNE